jgi:hypothetical protein
MDLERIIELSKIIAKPWFVATWILAVLLIFSVCGNIYLATLETEVVLTADNNVSSDINQSNG